MTDFVDSFSEEFSRGSLPQRSNKNSQSSPTLNSLPLENTNSYLDGADISLASTALHSSEHELGASSFLTNSPTDGTDGDGDDDGCLEENAVMPASASTALRHPRQAQKRKRDSSVSATSSNIAKVASLPQQLHPATISNAVVPFPMPSGAGRIGSVVSAPPPPAPLRARRRRKTSAPLAAIQAAIAVSDPIVDTGDVDQVDPNEPSDNKRERNKVSAMKYRQRRKQYMDTLEARVNELTETVTALTTENKLLKDQLDFFKNLMYRNSNDAPSNACVPIQQQCATAPTTITSVSHSISHSLPPPTPVDVTSVVSRSSFMPPATYPQQTPMHHMGPSISTLAPALPAVSSLCGAPGQQLHDQIVSAAAVAPGMRMQSRLPNAPPPVVNTLQKVSLFFGF